MFTNSILIIEDNNDAAFLIENFLQDSNFNVMSLSTITEAVSNITLHKFDLILLDLHLPDYNGFELLKFINKNNINIPVIITSAHNERETKLQAFKYGVSDYMTKPIDLEELEARIWVHIKRNSSFVLPKEKKTFEKKDNIIIFKGENLNLTKIEFDIASILLSHPNNLFTREDLAKQLSSKANERSLDYHIRNIRKKIGDDGANPHYLVTEYGLGYKLVI